MHVTIFDRPRQVMELLSGKETAINIVVSAPSVRSVRSAVRDSQNNDRTRTPCGITMTIMEPMVFIGARNARTGVVVVTGEIRPREVVFECVTSFGEESTGKYSFVGIQHSSFIDGLYYNPRIDHSQTWTTYRVVVDPSGSGTYEVLDVRSHGGRG
jgi:hypothetical protein